MHELSISRNIVAIAEQQCEGRRVVRIQVKVGELSCVMPDALHFCFDNCAQGTAAEGATLDIQRIPGEFLCSACNQRLLSATPRASCDCGARKLICIGGDELTISELELV